MKRKCEIAGVIRSMKKGLSQKGSPFFCLYSRVNGGISYYFYKSFNIRINFYIRLDISTSPF